MKFTDPYVRNLKTDKRMEDITEGDGFGVRVYGTGGRVFFFLYKFDGKRRFLNLGHYDPEFETTGPDGKKIGSLAYHRQKYIEAKNKLAKGVDPLGEKEQAKTERKQTPTVADFIAKEYIEKSAKKKLKRWEDVERALRVEVIPRWGRRKLSDITRRDIILLRDEIAVRAPIMANRVLAYVSGMFTYAIDQEAIKASPYANIKRAVKESSRERALAIEEVKQLWRALDGDGVLMSSETRNILKLILLTAQRPGEVAGMHTKELDGHWWTIPGSRTKNGKTHRVYLTDTALSLIGDTNRGAIFATDRGVKESITVNALSFAIRRNIEGKSVRTDKVKRRKGEGYKRGPYNSKPLPEKPNRIGIEIFCPQDLRRSAATLMAAEKVPYETRERVLNHTMGKLDDTYNLHDYDDEKQMAMETLERKICSILTGVEGKVISIQAGRKAA